MTRPPAEVDVDEGLVRALLEAQCPRFAGAPLRRLDEGWDNVTWLVGDAHAARLPRREAAVALLLHEQRWLPELAAGLAVAVPMPVHLGRPSVAFPWPWSVVRWVSGTTAERHRFASEDAVLLAETLRALHRPAPGDAPVNPFRGVPLRTGDEIVRARIERLGKRGVADLAPVEATWEDALSAPETEGRRWMHGDLHPGNVIVRDDRLAGLIDWGDLNGGDPATDLAAAWMLVDDAGVRRELLAAYGASDAEVRRARGWAAHMGLALADTGEARHLPVGLATLERLARDARRP